MANPLMERKLVGIVFFGVVAMVAVVTSPQLLNVVWRGSVAVVLVVVVIVSYSCSYSRRCSCGCVCSLVELWL